MASYYAPLGGYAVNSGYFNSQYNNGPLHVPASGGVYAYGTDGVFPANTVNATNYWVDAVLSTNTPPSVTAQTPTPGSTASTATTVTVTFNEPVQANTISFALKNASGNPVNGSLSYNATNYTATFTPNAALAPLTQYTATVSGATDFSNKVMAAPVSWSFTTAGPPQVTSETPAPGATSISTATAVMATFNEAVQPGTISFVLKDASGAVVPATVAYDGNTNTATLTPNATLATSTTYTATVSGAQDLYNDVMAAPAIWSFTTASTATVTIWSNATTPAIASANDSNATELGVKFRSDLPGTITGLRFYKGASNTGTHVGHLWTCSGTLLATATFSGETATGWQQVSFASPVAINPNTTYVVSYYAPSGHYAANSGYFSTSGYDSGPLHALADGVNGPDGVYLYGTGGGFPINASGATNYWVDVVFTPSSSTTPPAVTGQTPASGATGTSTATAVMAMFSEAVQPGTISFVLKDASSAVVPATVAYDGNTNTATLTPNATLATSTTYTATVSGAKDFYNNVMAAPAIWSFTTSSTATVTIWSNATTPAVASANDSNAVELGVKFRSDLAGTITGLRFYKGASNTGTHVGHLWTSSGTLLATATFSGETATGWQQVSFASPVTISANTTYVASYFAPAGGYAVNSAYFATSGYDSGPLHALADGVNGGDGVYAYGPNGTFPTGSYNATNYWVDVVFTPSGVATTPTVTGETPAPNATNMSVTTAVTAAFSEAVTPSTIAFVLRDQAGNTVATYPVSYDTATNTATLTPTAPLAAAMTYTATVSGATDASGYVMAAPFSWSFSTAPAGSSQLTLWSNSVTPANPSSSDSGAIEVGVKFTSDVAGYITGLRFYKGAGNSGTHVGHLWTSTGTLLATATFSGETATGWQQVSFASPVLISPDTTYVASYYAPQGHYAYNPAYFATSGVTSGPLHALADGVNGGDGVYVYGSGGTFPTGSYNATNFWVDVVFTTGPVVTGETPAPNATNVSATTAVTAAFNEPVTPSTIAFVLRDQAGNTMAANVSYDTATNTATLTPTAPLAAATTYTATVSGATDASGNVMTPFSWSFSTALAGSGPFTIWSNSATPANPSSSDTGAVEVGVKFTSDVAGTITGLRFYKGAGNGGTHVGHLWTSTGTLLATATFSGETATGWQQVNFASPVTISPNTTYVASYYARQGHYAYDPAYFATSGVDQRAAARAGQRGRRGERWGWGVRVRAERDVPDRVVQRDQLLGRRRLHRHRPIGHRDDDDGRRADDDGRCASNGGCYARDVELERSGALAKQDPSPTVQIVQVSSSSGAVTAGRPFMSPVFEAGQAATWGTVSWKAGLPPGATLVVEVRQRQYAEARQDLVGVVGGRQRRYGHQPEREVPTIPRVAEVGETIIDAGPVRSLDHVERERSGAPAGPASLVDRPGLKFAGLDPRRRAVHVAGPRRGPGRDLGNGLLEGRPAAWRDAGRRGQQRQYAEAQQDLVGVVGDRQRRGGLEAGRTLSAIPREAVDGGLVIDADPIQYLDHVVREQQPGQQQGGQQQPGQQQGNHRYLDEVAHEQQPGQQQGRQQQPGQQQGRQKQLGQQRGRVAASSNPQPSPAVQISSTSGSLAAGKLFTSPVFDAGQAATWGTVSWTADLPPDATLVLEVSNGNTPTPDSTWSPWAVVSNGGSVASPTARYLRYRVRLVTTDLTDFRASARGSHATSVAVEEAIFWGFNPFPLVQ